jgi:hypothetical protein
MTSSATLIPIHDLSSDDTSRDTIHDASAAQAHAEERPGIPYRSMTTLLGAALDQAKLIAPPLTRALELDERIGADPHLRRAQRLLAQLNEELIAELDALFAHTQAPKATTAADARGTARPSHR